jgi:cell wall-associated NlpC family hydrolase
MTLTEYLKHFIGRPYIWSGDGTGPKHNGFDCSGLVLEGLWAMGLYTGSDISAQGIYNFFSKKWKTRLPKNSKDGDLLFFGKSVKSITHVAVALGNGLMIEAGGGGSKCDTASNSTGFVRVRPITNRKDCLVSLYIA